MSEQSPSGNRTAWLPRALRIGRWVFAIAVLAALVKVAVDNADALRDVNLDIRWVWLAAALPFGLAAGIVLPLGWRRLVAAYGVAISRGHAVRVWCLSQTARYLPTGIAGFAARVVMAAKEGVPRTLTSATLAIELGLLAAWAGLLAAIFTPSSELATPWRVLLGVASAIAIVALPTVLALGGRLFPRAQALAPHLLDRRQMHEATVVYGVNAALKSARWLMIAAGVLTVHGSDIPLLIGAEALGVLAGLIGITPAGIGVREAVIAGVLRDRFGFAEAFALAVIAAAWDFVVELVWIGVALVLRRRTRTADPTSDRTAPASSLGDT